jgi:serine/threonine protein kinase
MTKPEPGENHAQRKFELSDGESQSTASGAETISYLSAGASSESMLPKNPAEDASPTVASSRYEVRSRLGSGAFGTVSLAWDRQLNREVAIKRPRSKLHDSAREMFLQEARLAAKVRHPAVVVVHDVQVDADGVPFIVYEYLPGKTLREKLQPNQPLPVGIALEFAIAIADGLAAAHKLGLTHRDLKPANILLDEDDRPHIADFGLAVEEGQQVALRGQLAGTLKYMSPEQVRGEAHHLDGRTDLWALGVILYQMLTGRHPFPGELPEELSGQILDRDPRPPRQWVREIPKSVENIVLKLLAKPVAERYASASEVAEELRRHLSGSLGIRLLRFGRGTSNPAFTASLIAVALIIVAATGAFWQLAGPKQPTTRIPSGHHPASLSAYPYSDAEYLPDNWHHLLTRHREVGEILFSPSSIRYWSPEGDTLFIHSRSFSLLEIGRTTPERCASFTLELTMKPDKWTDDCGLFLGYGGSLQSPSSETMTLLSILSSPSGKITLVPKSFQLMRQSGQTPTLLSQMPTPLETIDAPMNKTVTMSIDVTNNQISQFRLNSQPLTFPTTDFMKSLPCQGKFGIFSFGSSGSFSSCKIRVLPQEIH